MNFGDYPVHQDLRTQLTSTNILDKSPAPNADALRVLKLPVVAGRLHCLPDAINHNVRPVDDDEMAALLRDNLLAILREGEQRILQFDVFGAEVLVRADIHERLVAKRVRMLLADCVCTGSTFRHDFMVCLQGFLIPRLSYRPKMKLPVAFRQLAEVGVAFNSKGDGSAAWT